MPPELIIIGVTALLAGVLLAGTLISGRGAARNQAPAARPRGAPETTPYASGAGSTLRVVWWLAIAIVLVGVGISGSFAANQAPIFLVGAAGVVAVIAFHEVPGGARGGRLGRLAELAIAIGLVSLLLSLTGYAASPFAMLFALVSVASALSHGPRAGLAAAVLSTAALVGVLFLDPGLPRYGAQDALRLSTGLVATWLLAFVAIAYSAHQRRTLQRVIDLSMIDPLTGLLNRSQLIATLEQEVSRTRRSERGFCLLMIDLDGLKAINDSAGHLRGDEVLRALGTVISRSIRTVDSAYRFGGDEFVVLLPETNIVGAFVVAEKIRVGAEELATSADGIEPLTSVSIGLVSHPEDGLGAEELLGSVDRAMYTAKQLGKNQICGNPRPRRPLLARRSIEPVEPPSEPVVPVSPPEPSEPIAVGPAPAEPSVASGEPADGPGNGVTAPSEARAVAVQLGPTLPPADDDEADPQVVRRQIANASRSFDPDHQIRRAMDAFLSPGSRDRDRGTTPDA